MRHCFGVLCKHRRGEFSRLMLRIEENPANWIPAVGSDATWQPRPYVFPFAAFSSIIIRAFCELRSLMAFVECQYQGRNANVFQNYGIGARQWFRNCSNAIATISLVTVQQSIPVRVSHSHSINLRRRPIYYAISYVNRSYNWHANYQTLSTTLAYTIVHFWTRIQLRTVEGNSRNVIREMLRTNIIEKTPCFFSFFRHLLIHNRRQLRNAHKPILGKW